MYMVSKRTRLLEYTRKTNLKGVITCARGTGRRKGHESLWCMMSESRSCSTALLSGRSKSTSREWRPLRLVGCSSVSLCTLLVSVQTWKPCLAFLWNRGWENKVQIWWTSGSTQQGMLWPISISANMLQCECTCILCLALHKLLILNTPTVTTILTPAVKNTYQKQWNSF
jgi:hypothetical protein